MSHSEKFNAEKEIEINQIQRINPFIEKVKQNSHLLKLDSEMESKLENLLAKNKKLLHKLQSNEFEIAIVGLEKAGKSTFANALIENSILPSAPERCTFTETRLVSGPDRATIEFYTKAEFNDIFRATLKEIHFPNAENESYETLSLPAFESYFTDLEQKDNQLYKSHVGKTDEEIKDILKNREKIKLGGKIKEFAGDELCQDVFQSYIKGDDQGADTSKPRSVKKVQIESSKLKQLETAVIYDVPGFDSPTKIHIRQTEERLKAADAIILVTNAGSNPSIQGTSLSVITKNTDEDGINLAKKLFVFGNQLDKANSEDESKNNKEILIRDVEKYKIGNRNKVFCGSALKYLVENKIIEKEYTPSFSVNSGITEIRTALILYYETERFDILKQKIDSNKIHLKTVFQEIHEKLESDFGSLSAEDFSESEKARIVRETYKKIEEELENNLKQLKFDLKQEIWEEKYFSNKFREDVESFSCLNPIDEEYINFIKKDVDASVTRDTPVDKINQAIRTRLHEKFLDDFSNLIRKMTDEKSKEIEIRILQTFTKVMLGEGSSVLHDDIEQACDKFIKKLTVGISHNEGRFTYLIERFSRNIFDILISNPLLGQDRKNKYIEEEKEFRYLDNYYGNGNGSLINILLIGENKPILNFTDDNGITGAKDILNKLNKALNMIDPVSANVSKISLPKALVTTAIFVLDKISNKSDGHEFSAYNTDMIIESRARSATEEAVLQEIDKDIENLRDVLQKAVVPAINLELAFMNAIDKQIKVLIDSCKGTGKPQHNLFNEFISKIVPKIKSHELDNINQKIEERKLRLTLLDEMQAFKL
jgi:GTPase SAR1 family protein